MATPAERTSFLIINADGSSGSVKEQDLIKQLESKDPAAKCAALEIIIIQLLNGEVYTKIMMSVIKYCINTEHHRLKKLLMLYWETVPKRGKDGHALTEMILVCNALKKDLNHPNEYIRGSTLRLLTKMKEPEVLESLIPSVTQNLEHRHSYVRKNAVLTIMAIAETHPELIPDAAELVEKFLYQEANPAAKKNAFLMLFKTDVERAINYLNSVVATIGSLSESFQLLALELIRKVSKDNPAAKSQYIRCIYSLVNASSHAVSYEAANTLVALSSAPTAVKAAVTAFCQLLQSESDNNVKLIILNRLATLKQRNGPILQEMLMDIMRALASPNIEIRKKILQLALDLLSPRNVDAIVALLKKELAKTDTPEGKNEQYRKALVDTLHKCAIAHPDVVAQVASVLINYMGDENPFAARDVVLFAREATESYPHLRESLLQKLMEAFDTIKTAPVFRMTAWIIGEYAESAALIEAGIATIKNAIGPLPLVSAVKEGDEEAKQAAAAEEKAKASTPAKKAGPVVLADGSYASQSAAVTTADVTRKDHSTLRTLLVDGDYFLAACLSASLTKLLLKFAEQAGHGSEAANEQIAKGLLLMVSILRLGSSPNASKPMDLDSHQRILSCIRVLMDPKNMSELFLSQNRAAFQQLLREVKKHKQADDKKGVEVVRQADDLLSIRQLRGKAAMEADLGEDEEEDLSRALGKPKQEGVGAALNRVYQLTGFADPVYAEAHLSVVDFDIVLEILVVNQTNTTLQNVQVELHTSGDLKLMDRPQQYTIGPLGLQRLTNTIKVTSTESGVIFGNIVYDTPSGANKTIVVLDNIHMDVMDYIQPASCTDLQFRSMWAEFEWENKVAVNTDIADTQSYLNHILKITNMRCLTPQGALTGPSVFLAANLYARSMFGEDALLNLSVEKQKTGKVTGYIRIRSKTQGIALSLGDKITANQRTATA